jgi:hypothetical protein
MSLYCVDWVLMWHVLIGWDMRRCGMLLEFLELFLMEKGDMALCDFIEFLELFFNGER